MTLQNFYQVLGNAVKYFPQSTKKYEMIQTFALLRYREEMNSDNLGKNIDYKDSPYFYSRKWEALRHNPSKVGYEYPILAVFPVVGDVSDLLNTQKNPKSKTKLELNFLYPNARKSERNLSCPPLLVEDIYKQMRMLSLTVFDYLKGVVCAIPDGQADHVWRHEGLLAAAVSADEITGYTINKQETKKYLDRLRRLNETVSFNYVDDVGVDFMCGVKYRIDFEEPDCDINNNYVFRNLDGCCVDHDWIN